MMLLPVHPSLTISPKGANFLSIGKRICESRLSRKDETMKLTLTACRAATHAYQIHTTVAGRSFGTEEQPRVDREADGRTGLARGRSALAEIHQPESRQWAPNESANAVYDDGSVGARRGNARANPEQNACGGSNDRARRVVTQAGLAPALPSPTLIIREALRAAALAPTYQDALDVTGEALRRLAELARAEVSRG